MRLVVDTSVLIGELLRVKGRERLGDDRLELMLAEQTAGEVQHELPRRIRRFATRRGIPEDDGARLTTLCFEAIAANIVVVAEAGYAPLEDEARRRSSRDPYDWPVVACALMLDAAICTADEDFLGVGVATWTTPTLQAWLEHHDQ